MGETFEKVVGPDRCPAIVLLRDDRWGGFTDRCDLAAGHEGPHMSPMDACEPRAWLSWIGTYERHEVGGAGEGPDEGGEA